MSKLDGARARDIGETRASHSTSTARRRARLAQRPLHKTTLFALLAGMPMLLVPAHALAQDVPPPPSLPEAQAQDEAAEAIVVTGTRISGFTAPTPVTTISAAEIETRVASTVSDLLDDVPQLRINQNIGKSSEPVGASNADLRGLGTQRTLVLIDGRRVAPTDPAGTIDTNIVPVALIRNVEIVTGGASAAYGSDAVAGVVNFVLDDRFEGFKLDMSYGQSIYDDHRRPSLSAAWGTSLLDGRLNITLGADYLRNSGQTAQGERPWGRNQTALLTNPAYTPTNGQPRLIIADNARFSQMTAGGVLTRANGLALANLLGFAPGTGVQFGPNGEPVPFTYGTTIGGTFMAGGDGGSVSDEGNILPRIERATGYAGLRFSISDNVTFFANALYSLVDVRSDLAPNPDNGGLAIRVDNAFLDARVRDAMVAASLPSITIGRYNLEDGDAIFDNETEVQRYTFGLEGEFGGGWRWDVSGQIGRNRYESISSNNRINARWLNGIDTVIDPTSGQPVCRALLNNPNPTDAQDPYRDIRDCVPINPFGAGSISPAALDYYRGTSFTRARQEQDVFAASLSGRPFSTWAGDVSVAVGAEYRREQTVLTADPNSAVRRWRSINAQPFDGSFNVKEGFVEVVVPLASGAPMADNLELNGALRYTDYSTSGGVATWKIGVNYSPFADLRARATLSRDIRAPNNFELFSRGNQVISPIIDPRDNLARQTVQITSGNPDLQPERADTFTIGLVYQPSWLPGLRTSIDYYSIRIEDAISTVSAQNIVDFCEAGQTDFCSGVVRDGGGTITRVNVTPFNAQSLKTSGIDFEMQYRFALGGGQMSLRGLVNYVDELVTTANGVANDYVGLAGVSPPPQGVPQWRVNLDVSYTIDRLRLGLNYRYIDGGNFDTRFNRTVLDIADNAISGRSYVDIFSSYDLTRNLQIYGRVENLFNQDPPIAPNGIYQPTIANSPFFDRRGTFWAVGARIRL